MNTKVIALLLGAPLVLFALAVFFIQNDVEEDFDLNHPNTQFEMPEKKTAPDKDSSFREEVPIQKDQVEAQKIKAPLELEKKPAQVIELIKTLESKKNQEPAAPDLKKQTLHSKHLIHIQVNDEKGSPIEGAKIEVSDHKSATVFTKGNTDKLGKASLVSDQDSSGVYVVVKSKGLANLGYGHIKIDEATSETPHLFVLKTGTALHGMVQNKQGEPVADAEVIVDRHLKSGNHSHLYRNFEKTKSDDTGKFTFKHMAPGKITLRVQADRFISASPKSLTLPYDEELKIKVVPSLKKKLFIVNAEGVGIAHATIIYKISRSEVDSFLKSSHMYKLTVKSDAKGEVDIHTLEEGFLSVQITHEDYKHFEKKNIPLDQTETHTLTLDRGIFIEGFVKDKLSDEAVTEATVVCTYKDEKGKQKTTQSKTQDDGSFKLKGLPKTRVTIFVRAKNFLASDKKVMDLKEVLTSSEVVFLLEKGFTLEGLLLNSSKEPLRNQSFSYSFSPQKDRRSYTSQKTSSDESGLFSIGGLDENVEKVKINCAGYISLEKSVQLENNEVQKFVLTKGADVLIVVKNEEGGVIDQANFRSDYNKNRSHSRDFSPFYQQKYNPSKKAFEVKGLTDGTYSFFVKSSGYHKSDSITISVQKEQENLIEVILKKSQGSKIFVRGEGTLLKTSGKFHLSSKNNSSGGMDISFSKDLKAHVYKKSMMSYDTFTIKLKGWTISKKISIKKAGNPDAYEYGVSVERGVTQSGVVVDENAKPIKSARVTIKKDRSVLESTQTDANGRYTLTGLGTGLHSLEVAHSDYTQSKIKVTIFSQEADFPEIILRAGASLSGKVLDVDSQPIRGIDITLLKKSPWGNYQKLYISSRSFDSVSDDQGGFSFDKLPDDSYSILAKNSKHGFSDKNFIEVKGGQSLDDIVIQLKRGSSISGMVQDENGVPIDGVQIHANIYPHQNGSSQQLNAESSEEGHFSIKGLEEGKQYTLYVSSDEWKPVKQNVISKAPSINLILSMKKATILRGRVLNSKGEVVKDYSLQQQSTLYAYRSEIYNLNIDEEGIFSFTLQNYNPSQGDLKLIATAPGYGEGVSEDILLKKYGGELIQIHLQDNQTRNLIVKDEDSGSVLNDVEVYLLVKDQKTQSYMNFNGHESIGRTHEQGFLLLEGLKDADFKITLKKPEYADISNEFSIKGTDMLPLEIHMNRGGSLIGTITSVEGEALPEMEISLKSTVLNSVSYYSGQQALSSVSDTKGFYQIKNIPEGEYSVVFKKRKDSSQMSFFSGLGDSGDSKKVSIIKNQEITLNLGGEDLEGLGSIEGTIAESSRDGVFMVILYKAKTDNMMPAGSAQLDENFKFSFKNIQPGSYSVMLTGRTGGMFKVPVEVSPGESTKLLIDKPKTGLKGMVLDSDNKPLVSGQVILFSQGELDSSNPMALLGKMVSSGMVQDGKFELLGIAEGSYKLVINEANFSSAGAHLPLTINDVQVEANIGITDIGTFTMLRGKSLSGQVLSPEGTGVSGAGFYIDLHSDTPFFGQPTFSDSEGSFTLKNTPTESFKLIAQAKGYAPTSVEVKGDSIEISLTRGGTVLVQLRGKNIEGRKLSLLDSSKKEPPFIWTQDNMALMRHGAVKNLSSAEGSFEFTHIAAGSYYIKIHSSDDSKEVISEKFSVSEDQSSSVEISL